MIVHNVEQGSREWLSLRARPNTFTASEAPAMMGASKYQSREQLLRQKATGLTPEVDAMTQSRYDAGHATEAAFRPHAETLAGDDLFPVTGTIELDGMTLLASFDGLTMDYAIGYEHKLLNQKLVEALNRDGEPGPMYYWQLEHQLLVANAQQIIFVTSDGTTENMAMCRYQSKPERRAELIAGWKQFAADLADYDVPEVAAPKPIGRTRENLPALLVQITGGVQASNLAEFTEHARAVFQGINRKLETDQQFADAEQDVKWCEAVETKLENTKAMALAQTATIEQLFLAIDAIKNDARTVRLELEKLVKARKEQIRNDVLTEAIAAYRKHAAALNERIAPATLPLLEVDFAGSMKGKRTVQGLKDGAQQELVRAKLVANGAADKIQANLKTIDAQAEYAFLFPDKATIAHKAPDDLKVLVDSRIANHIAAEKVKKDAEAEQARRDAEAAAATPVMQTAPAVPAGNPGNAGNAGNVFVPQTAQPTGVVFQTQAKAADNEKPTLKLGEISTRLGFLVTADFLSTLGFTATVDRSSKLYRESEFPLMCAAITAHVNHVLQEYQKAWPFPKVA